MKGCTCCPGLPAFIIFHYIERVYYLRVRRTGVASPKSGIAGRVFQAKTGFVSFGHFTSGNDIQQVVVTEGVHAVVVPWRNRREPTGIEVLYIILSSYVVPHLLKSFLSKEDSLVTAVPVPLVSGLDWKKVTGSLVLHFLGKAQKDPEVDVSDCWCIC